MTSIGRVFHLQLYWRCIAETHILLTELSLPELVRHLRQDKSWWRVDIRQTLSRTGCSHKVGSSSACQRVKSDIYLSLSIWHSTSTTNFSSRELKLSEASSLTILSITVDPSELFYLIFIFYVECFCAVATLEFTSLQAAPVTPSDALTHTRAGLILPAP